MASAHILFDSPLVDLMFAGNSQIVGLFKEDVKVAWTTTGNHHETIEVDTGSSSIFGVKDAVFLGCRTEGLKKLDLKTTSIVPIYSIKKENKDEMMATCLNPLTEMIYTNTWNRDAKTSTIKTCDPRATQDGTTFRTMDDRWSEK